MRKQKHSVLSRSVRSTLDSGHPEAGGVRSALLGVVLISSVLAFAFRTEPTLDHQRASANIGGTYFARNVTTAWRWYQKQNHVALDQIAINAAQEGVSFNACAEDMACATKYDKGSDQNVPQGAGLGSSQLPSWLSELPAQDRQQMLSEFPDLNRNSAANTSSYAFNWKNWTPYLAPVKYTRNGQPYTPQEFGGLYPVWQPGPTSEMSNSSPIGFWWVYADSPNGHQMSLKDYFSFEQSVLSQLLPKMFGYPNAMAFGAIEPMVQGKAGTATGWKGDLAGSGGTMRLLTWGATLSYPVSGATQNAAVPSLHGLDPSTANAWGTIVNPSQNAKGSFLYGHEVLANLKSGSYTSPAYGYFFPAIAGSIRVVPAGLALNQYDGSGCESECSTCNIHQIQTNGSGGTKNVIVDSYGTYCPPPPPSSGSGSGTTTVQETAGGAIIKDGMIYTSEGKYTLSSFEANGGNPQILPGTYQVSTIVLNAYNSSVTQADGGTQPPVSVAIQILRDTPDPDPITASDAEAYANNLNNLGPSASVSTVGGANPENDGGAP